MSDGAFALLPGRGEVRDADGGVIDAGVRFSGAESFARPRHDRRVLVARGANFPQVGSSARAQFFHPFRVNTLLLGSQLGMGLDGGGNRFRPKFVRGESLRQAPIVNVPPETPIRCAYHDYRWRGGGRSIGTG